VASNTLRLWKFRNFDPSAPLPPVPSVQELVRKAEGEIDDEDTIKREADKARRRLKGKGASMAEDDEDAVIEDAEDDDIEIVDGEDDGEAAGGDEDAEADDDAPAGPSARGAKTAHLAPDAADDGRADGDEE
jgi:hypothetical protein